MSDLFISHSSKDGEESEKLEAALSEQKHHSIFLDRHHIKPGESWEQKLYTQLRACRAVVALCSKHYLASQWCFAEIALARMEGKALFVLQIGPWDKETQMPSILMQEQIIDLRTNREDGYRKLGEGFKSKGIVPSQAREWSFEYGSPYPGLRAFEETDAPIFFGREKEVREGIELLSRVQRQGHPRLVMVLGSSGSGKSSLARAGLVPRLRSDGKRWLVVGPFRPGVQPTRELSAALRKAFSVSEARTDEAIYRRLMAGWRAQGSDPSAGRGTALEASPEPARQRLLEALRSLGAELTEADAGVARSVKRVEQFLAASAAAEAATAAPPGEQEPGEREPDEPEAEEPGPGDSELEGARDPLVDLADELRRLRGSSGANVLLVIDQFEELLGREDEGDDDANLFLCRLRAALEAKGSPLLALGTMRSDYLGMLQRARPLQGLGFKSLSVGPMSSPDGMREVIVKPAGLCGLNVDGALVERLLRDTGTSDALPLLAFTLAAMWDPDDKDRGLTEAKYKEFGGLDGAVRTVANETLETALALGEESQLRDAFLKLARETAEGSGWSRKSTRWDDLDESVQPMMKCFVDQHLLVRGEHDVEVVHEALFRSWEKLRDWLDENAEGMRLRTEIEGAAAEWTKAGKDEAYLWRGARLARALELKKKRVLPLEESDRSFVEASDLAERADAEAELRRAKRLALGACAVVVVMLVLGFFVWRAQVEAKRQAVLAEAGQLAAMASSRLPEAIDEALMLAVEAVDKANLPDTRNSLVRALQSAPQVTLRGHESRVNAVAFSPTENSLASVGDDGRAVLWRRAGDDWQQTPLLGLASSLTVRTVSYSPSGSFLATGDDDGMVRLWSVTDGGESGEAEQAHDGLVAGLAFSPAGGLLASGGQYGQIRLWQLTAEEAGKTRLAPAAGKPLTLDKGGTVLAVAFSHDGEWLASASEDGVVRIWEIAARRLLGEFTGPAGQWATSVAFAPKDRTRLVSGGADGGIRLWSLKFESDGTQLKGSDDELLGVLQQDTGVAVGRHEGKVWTLAFSLDGKRLTSGGEDGRIRFWTVATGSESVWQQERALGAHRGFVNGIAYSRRGDRLVSGGDDGRLRLWDVDAGGPLGAVLVDPGEGIKSVAYETDGERLVWAGEDGLIRILDLDGDDEAREIGDHQGLVYGLALSSREGKAAVLAAGGDNGVWLWQEGLGGEWSGGRLADQPEEVVRSLAFSRDGARFVSGYQDGAIWSWEPKDGGWSGRSLAVVTSGGGAPDQQRGAVLALAFSPDGDSLLSGSADGTVWLWKSSHESWDGGVLEKHLPGRVDSLAFSRDGQIWVSGGWDDAEDQGSVVVWRRQGDAWQPRRLAGLQDQSVHAVALSPSGATVASGGWDDLLEEGALQLWDVGRGRPLGAPLRGHSTDVRTLAFSPNGTALVSGGDSGELLSWDYGIDIWLRRACAAVTPVPKPHEDSRSDSAELAGRRICQDLTTK